MKKLTVEEALKTYGSPEMIGAVKERFDTLNTRYNDILGNETWRAFYDGWIEGRFAMYGELLDMAHPDVKPSRWEDFKDFVKTVGGCLKRGIIDGLRMHQAQIREEVIMFWKVEIVLILVFLAFVLGACVMATFGVQDKCYFP
jgi:hypothetical protein